MTLLLHSTETALWQGIIHDACAHCAIDLKEDLEAYLVFLLMRYMNRPDVVKQIIATEFLQSLDFAPKRRAVALQEVGDKCLLFVGLYPCLAQKRLVKLGYFVNLGQAAYIGVSRASDDLYALLGKQFVSLMDILQAIRLYTRDFPDLMPLEAFELWNETGSQRAFSVLRSYTSGIPISFKK